MPLFEYSGADPNGAPVRGTMFSASVTSAASDLERQGFRVDHLGLVSNPHDPIPSEFGRTEAAPPPTTAAAKDITSERSYVQTHVLGQVINKIPLSILLFFFRSLHTMTRAGVSPVQSLETIAGQQRDPRMRAIGREMQAHALEGRPLSFGMQRYPEVFTPLMVSLIRTGEEAGMLEKSLLLVATYIDKEIKLRNLIRRLTLYPKIVVGASIIIIMGANSIIGMFNGKPLWSPLTQPATWVCLAPWIVGIWAFIKFGLPNPNVKTWWDQFLGGIPYLGKTIKLLAMAKFGRALGALYQGGVPLHRATLLAADACGNEYIRGRIYPAARDLEQGASVFETFARTGVVDGIVLDMVKTGETTGNLDQMLEKVADFYEDDAEVRANVMANILGVVALLAVGVYVLFVVLTFYTGYFAGMFSAAQ